MWSHNAQIPAQTQADTIRAGKKLHPFRRRLKENIARRAAPFVRCSLCLSLSLALPESPSVVFRMLFFNPARVFSRAPRRDGSTLCEAHFCLCSFFFHGTGGSSCRDRSHWSLSEGKPQLLRGKNFQVQVAFTERTFKLKLRSRKELSSSSCVHGKSSKTPSRELLNVTKTDR